MELALQFENLNCEELCAIDGGKRNYSIEKYVKNYFLPYLSLHIHYTLLYTKKAITMA